MNPQGSFLLWQDYWGSLHNDGDPRFPTQMYGFENESDGHRQKRSATIPNVGGCFGFLASGHAQISDEKITWELSAGQWFSLPSGAEIELLVPQCRLIVCQRMGYLGVRAMGGPIEDKGRLRYIDGCSDTLLAASPILGDPCLNLLHFPKGIDQTEHFHPSTRAGIVARGHGYCVTPDSKEPLEPGMIFFIPRDGKHKFQTTQGSEMDVIAYHPDSDWGPTHQIHPMINRTLVDGKKMDNSEGVHAKAETVLRG